MIKYFFVLLSIFSSINCISQNHSQKTLYELLETAESNYPLLKSKKLSIDAAQKRVEMSKSTLIPSLDAAYQVNYATYNNITGMANPQFLVPISGPPSSGNEYEGVFGSAGSLLLNWKPVTFGQREAEVAYSQTGVKYAIADASNELLQHKVKVITTYLDALIYDELIKVYQENIARTSINYETAKTLVNNGIKPGADSALFSSEVSKAKIDLLNAKKNKEAAMINLAELLASKDSLSIKSEFYFTRLPDTTDFGSTSKNPLLSLYNTSIELDLAKRKSIVKTTLPTLGVWATTFARGSGISYEGNVNSLEGMGLQRFNYGVGLQLSIPILQSFKIRSELQYQDLIIKADQEKVNELILKLDKQLLNADMTLKYALKIAKEGPLLIESANYAYKAVQSRYNSGLTDHADLIQAQYNLLKAQTDNKTAYMAVWKTILYKAAIKGDLNLFLNQIN
ncbi:TolC family protein [Flavobacterium piscis]|uniref:Outer membrane protein TolC n=1 Tax=Flavobacterium piscis TaxID=1114874 RepID=A0ABU1Y578_9FLAO|nr:TolC family protein [Flavobacterium piscis]MDR7209377.1 outer membrane protein TolC [Flavobacterium piscis]